MFKSLAKKLVGGIALTAVSLSLVAAPVNAMQPKGPNLDVIGDEVHFWLETAEDGRKFAHASVDVTNNSDFWVNETFKIGFQMRYYKEDIFYALAPWETRRASVAWELDDHLWSGINPVKVTLDIENNVTEHNESDNTIETQLSIPRLENIGTRASWTDKPDLFVQGVDLYKINADGTETYCDGSESCFIYPGDNIALNAIIENRGAPFTAPFDVELKAGANTFEEATFYQTAHGGIYSGDWTVLRYVVNVPKVSNPNGEWKNLEFNIDPNAFIQGGAIDEEDENNNFYAREYFVNPFGGGNQIEMPELAITGIEMTRQTQDGRKINCNDGYCGAMPGEIMNLAVQITNQGLRTSDWSQVRMIFNPGQDFEDTRFVDLPYLPIGESTWVAQDFSIDKISAYTHNNEEWKNFDILVDPRNTVIEENESNNWTQVGFLTTIIGEGILETPTIYTPNSGDHFTHYPRSTYVDWSDVRGADKYEIEVDCYHCVEVDKWSSEASGTPWMIEGTPYSEYKFDFVGDQEGRVRVRAVNPLGQSSYWSNWVYFSYNTSSYSTPAPTTPPIVTVLPTPPIATISPLPPAGFEREIDQTVVNPFSDTDMDTLEGRAAAFLYDKAIAGGYPDGEFKGFRPVNRAEIAKFMLNADPYSGDYSPAPGYVNPYTFADVPAGSWFYDFVYNAAAFGYVNGYPDGLYRPAETVNTAEFLKMLTVAFDLNTNMKHMYTDVEADAWYEQYAGVAEKYNLFPHRGDRLDPGKELNRYEVAVAFYNFLTQHRF